jgi:hypothetical protein
LVEAGSFDLPAMTAPIAFKGNGLLLKITAWVLKEFYTIEGTGSRAF